MEYSNRLILIKDLGMKKHGNRNRRFGLFQCECGNIKEIVYSNVKTGKTRSCGCLKKEIHSTHGLCSHKLNAVWRRMKQRCTNKKSVGYADYGGRGIFMCDEWKNDFLTFYNWCINNGYEEGLQIDRIDNEDGYYPLNCQFITQAENVGVGKQRISSKNTSGFIGVNWNKREKKWQVRIKYLHIGYFKDLESAVEARINAEIEIFGEQKTNFNYKEGGNNI